jgi:methylamine dehydrogenase heavy chain
MRTLRVAVLSLVLLLPFAASVPAQEPIAPETMTTEVIPAGTPKLFVADIAITHIVDGKLYIYNADDLSMLGTLGTGFTGQIYVPPAEDVVYVSTSYIEKISRGKRSDFLEVYDSSALTLHAEIPIASSRAQALNYRPLMQGSVDGRWMFIQNATPATSITVVDLEAGEQVGEIPNPGCYGIYPSSEDGRRFATMCGDGTFGTYVLAEDGSDAERTASEPIFDPDENALFIHGERDGDTWLFVTFKGDLYRVDLEGDTATLVEQKTFAAEGWRPSGYQTHFYHQPSGTLFVLMHPNGEEGSHKNPGEEIWAYDVAGGGLLSRSPTSTAFSLTGGRQDGAPVLYAANLVEAQVHRYTADPDADYALTETGVVAAGEAPLQLETQ